MRDLAGHTVDLYFKGPADKTGSWQILLGTIQPNKNNGRPVAISSPEEKAILGLLQRWHSRLPASRLAKGQRNDQNTMEIMTRLEERN